MSAQTSTKAVVPVAGTLRILRGTVTLAPKRANQTAPDVAVHRSISLQPGTVIAVGKNGSAEITLNATRARYQLAADSTARVSLDGKLLHAVSGAFPKRLTSKSMGDASGHLVRQDNHALRNVLAPLQDKRLQAFVTRNEKEVPVYAPLSLTPAGAVAAPPEGKIILKWIGQNDESVGEKGCFRVRVADCQNGNIAYSTTCPSAARDTPIPKEKLTPGVWYLVSVALMDDEESATSVHQAGTFLRLLTAKEAIWLSQKLEAAKNAPHINLMRARAYQTVGMARDAVLEYRLSLREKDQSASSIQEIKQEIELLCRLFPNAPAGKEMEK